jgi:hypothetical protein
MATTKRELTLAMQELASVVGFDELSKLIAKTLITIAHQKGTAEATFETDAGTVTVRPTMRDRQCLH